MPGGRTSAGAPARSESSKPALRLCVCARSDGPPQRIRDKGQQHLPGDEAWLIGEHRPSGEKKYYLANLPAKTGLRCSPPVIKARWICEQAHQQLSHARTRRSTTSRDIAPGKAFTVTPCDDDIARDLDLSACLLFGIDRLVDHRSASLPPTSLELDEIPSPRASPDASSNNGAASSPASAVPSLYALAITVIAPPRSGTTLSCRSPALEQLRPHAQCRRSHHGRFSAALNCRD